jgi:hypothetical protein
MQALPRTGLLASVANRQPTTRAYTLQNSSKYGLTVLLFLESIKTWWSASRPYLIVLASPPIQEVKRQQEPLGFRHLIDKLSRCGSPLWSELQFVPFSQFTCA